MTFSYLWARLDDRPGELTTSTDEIAFELSMTAETAARHLVVLENLDLVAVGARRRRADPVRIAVYHPHPRCGSPPKMIERQVLLPLFNHEEINKTIETTPKSATECGKAHEDTQKLLSKLSTKLSWVHETFVRLLRNFHGWGWRFYKQVSAVKGLKTHETFVAATPYDDNVRTYVNVVTRESSEGLSSNLRRNANDAQETLQPRCHGPPAELSASQRGEKFPGNFSEEFWRDVECDVERLGLLLLTTRSRRQQPGDRRLFATAAILARTHFEQQWLDVALEQTMRKPRKRPIGYFRSVLIRTANGDFAAMENALRPAIDARNRERKQPHDSGRGDKSTGFSSLADNRGEKSTEAPDKTWDEESQRTLEADAASDPLMGVLLSICNRIDKEDYG